MEISDSGCSTPYMTAPSSPPRLASTAFFSQFDHNPSLKDANFALPPPSSPKHFPEDQLDFAFHFAGIFHDTPLSAEDLFHHGKIKPLRLLTTDLATDSETEQTEGVVFKTANSSPRRRNVFHDAFSSSPRKRKDVDLAPSSDEDVGRRSAKREFNHNPNWEIDDNSTFKLTKARSLSPFPVSDMLFDDDDQAKQSNVKTTLKSTTTSSFWASFSFTKAYRKWKIKDLLFRSASEGRSTDKVTVDPALMNYTILTKRKCREDRNQVKAESSFRSSSNGSSSMNGSGSGRRRGGVPVSAHELHYTVNRAVSEEMKRKTFLPYKQSLLGCLGFNPGGHEFSGGVGSTARV
ncbi:unnamed protein product [Rhodiola kirilowii]